METAGSFGSGGHPNIDKVIWIQRLGAFEYYSLILAAFNPITAEAIFDNRADVIAKAFVSKMAYEHVEPKKGK